MKRHEYLHETPEIGWSPKVIEALKEFTQDEKLCDAFAWSLGLVSRILVRTITEGSTLAPRTSKRTLQCLEA